MKVSVLIPCWNYGRFLPTAIESVLAQTYSDYDITVVDDGSEDNTAAVCRNYPQVKYLYCAHRGVAAARNTAIRASDGEMIAFLDADDQYVPDKLKKQVQYMQEHPDCRIVFTGLKNFLDESVEHPDGRMIRLLNQPVPEALPSALICRGVFDRAGLFNEAYERGEDTDWLLRVSAAGISISHVIPEELYLRRIHEDNTTGDTVDKQALLRMVRHAAMLKKNRGKGQ
ncbi:MAG: glycosyltransferase family 2 protein [Solobacterium sp.]|nr:glycosyltransferase family 2 protein [Solobacterium sp.]MBR2726971.1 glycosyltransferase family 2 protein [Solobacterium sp.]